MKNTKRAKYFAPIIFASLLLFTTVANSGVAHADTGTCPNQPTQGFIDEFFNEVYTFIFDTPPRSFQDFDSMTVCINGGGVTQQDKTTN
jgi:hypothetical protein